MRTLPPPLPLLLRALSLTRLLTGAGILLHVGTGAHSPSRPVLSDCHGGYSPPQLIASGAHGMGAAAQPTAGTLVTPVMHRFE